ncbi:MULTISPECIES: DUF6603 domain-containing protein [unclassified Streptomyces]|uniref:DUF6603 domain-containing protein n=1 Tax=unclassified Streptomyces TaxID=2593676 RepID=UPI00224DBFD2|nr:MULTISPECIES: DUF6603 domain-containing protein [unclassified Streptomyces]MCX4529424.1 hypothetical protein [Streptomyces sp. NBC_01551]MCX4540036.1 hypothetical protein [Streptomyces sp. NBC_01565]
MALTVEALRQQLNKKRDDTFAIPEELRGDFPAIKDLLEKIQLDDLLVKVKTADPQKLRLQGRVNLPGVEPQEVEVELLFKPTDGQQPTVSGMGARFTLRNWEFRDKDGNVAAALEALAGLELAGPQLRIAVGSAVELDGAGPSGKAARQLAVCGQLSVPSGEQPQKLELVLNVTDTGKGIEFRGGLKHAAGLPLTGLAAAVGIDLSALPAETVPKIKHLALTHVPGKATLLTTTVTSGTTTVPIVLGALPRAEAGGKAGKEKPKEKPKPIGIVLADVPLSAGIADLPLLQGKLPASANLTLDKLQIIGLTDKPTKAELKRAAEVIKAAFDKSVKTVPKVPAKPEPRLGPALALHVTVGGKKSDPILLRLPAKGGKKGGGKGASTGLLFGIEPPEPTGTELTPYADESTDDRPLLEINRTFGPLRIDRLTLALVKGGKGALAVRIDAALIASGIVMEAKGLGLCVSLDGTFATRPTLEGLGVAYSGGPVGVQGALISRKPQDGRRLQLDGLVAITTPSASIAAAGSYATMENGYTSLFVFGEIGGRLGGPPPFAVTGICAGFGYNSSVRAPQASEVPAFPFVEGLTGSKGIKGKSPTEALDKISGGDNPWVKPASGEIWLAAGLSFTSFEFINCTAVLLAQFGSDFSIALLGRAKAQFPKVGTAYAEIELGFRAAYQMSKGELMVAGELTKNCWVLTRECRLTRGAAFATWFPGSGHEGDFALTVGGYHPDFNVPAHYPRVPRLGFNWAVSSAVTIKGEVYYAITPAAGMLGGRLSLDFDSGGLHAWLDATLDALLQWAPFYFRARIKVTVGASYTVNLLLIRVRIKAEFRAHLEMWGPPTGGRIRLEVGPFSVTPGFGEDPPSKPASLKWEDFRTQLPAVPVTVNALSGLMGAGPAPAAGTYADPPVWRVGGDGFSFVTRTAVPATELRLTTSGDKELWSEKHANKLDIRPMRLTGGASVHTVKVTHEGRKFNHEGWKITTVTSQVPHALWGTPVDGEPGMDDLLLPDRFTGLKLEAPAPKRYGDTVNIPLSELKVTPLKGSRLPLAPHARPEGTKPERRPDSVGTIARTIAAELPQSRREILYHFMQGFGLAAEAKCDRLTRFAAQAVTGLCGEPMIAPASVDSTR